MSCKNKVSFYVQRGYDYSEVFVKCGNTNPYGTRSTCKECSNDVDKMKNLYCKKLEYDDVIVASKNSNEYE